MAAPLPVPQPLHALPPPRSNAAACALVSSVELAVLGIANDTCANKAAPPPGGQRPLSFMSGLGGWGANGLLSVASGSRQANTFF